MKWSRRTVLLVELFMMKQRLARTDVCCRIRWSHREQTSFCERQVNSSLQKAQNRKMKAPMVHSAWYFSGNWKCHLLVSSRVGGSASPRSSNSTALWPQRGMSFTRSWSHRVDKNIYGTHAKFSFWLRVTQVSGKQAMFPRIPTQISYRNEQRRINLKSANDYILLLSHINSPWDVDNVI